jgi:putative ABC transport system permease protein
MALGAEAHAVVRLFLKDSGRVLAMGLVLGLVAATLMARTLESQLYGVRAFDLPTLIAGASLLAAAGVLATWWPARRASLRSPVVALKEG